LHTNIDYFIQHCCGEQKVLLAECGHVHALPHVNTQTNKPYFKSYMCDAGAHYQECCANSNAAPIITSRLHHTIMDRHALSLCSHEGMTTAEFSIKDAIDASARAFDAK